MVIRALTKYVVKRIISFGFFFSLKKKKQTNKKKLWLVVVNLSWGGYVPENFPTCSKVREDLRGEGEASMENSRGGKRGRLPRDLGESSVLAYARE